MIEYVCELEDARYEMDWMSKEEIVRCRDCAYILHRKYNNGFEYQTCSYFDSEHAEVEPNGFCAWGEWRNQDEDNG